MGGVVAGLRGAIAFALAAALLAAALLAAVAPPARAATSGLPIGVDLSQSLAEQFSYTPAYTQHLPAFDSLNRPYIRSRTASQNDTSFVHTLVDGAWAKRGLLDALRAAYPDFAGTLNAGGWATDRIVFDSQDRAYTLLTIRLEEGEVRNLLLYSLDQCASWHVCRLPFGAEQPDGQGLDPGNIACETFVGHNLGAGPPFIAVWRRLSDWPGKWASRNALYVMQPTFEGERLVVPAPTLVSQRFLGMVQCAGGTSFAVTAGTRTYFVFAAVTETPLRGTPIYVSYFDHVSGTVGPRTRVCRAQPGNNVHCTPGICIDSQGFLHVVSGAHGKAFRYVQSLRPRDTSAWTEPEKVLTAGYRNGSTDADGVGKQTYASMVCDANDTLHLVFRQARRNVDERHPGLRYHALSYQSRPAGGPWSDAQPLVYRRDAADYINYYQKLTLDRRGRLWLSLSLYLNADLEWLRPLRRFHHRMVLVSDDGVGWGFATTQDFVDGLLRSSQSSPP